jgi:sensor histidine kinase YesM
MKYIKGFLLQMFIYLLLVYLSLTTVNAIIDGRGFKGWVEILRVGANNFFHHPFTSLATAFLYSFFIPTILFLHIAIFWLCHKVRYHRKMSIFQSVLLSVFLLFTVGLFLCLITYLGVQGFSTYYKIPLGSDETDGLNYVWFIFSPKVLIGILIPQLLLMPVYLWGMDLIRENVKQSRGSSELEA